MRSQAACLTPAKRGGPRDLKRSERSLRPSANGRQRNAEERLHALWVYAALPGSALIVLLLALARGYLIRVHAVNVPYWDEWDQLSGLSARLDFSWLWGLHNEHRIVTTRFVIWLLYQFDGWNLITGLWVNYEVYLLVPALFLVIARQDATGGHWALVPFLIFFFSNAGAENDVAGFQIQWRFFVVFLLLAVWLLFDEKQRWGTILAGVLCLVLSMVSLASGIPAAAALIGVYAGFKLARLRAGFPARRELGGLALTALLTAAGAAVWLIGWHKNPSHPPLVLPTHRLFWMHLLNQVSLTIGTDFPFAPLGAGILAALGTILGADAWRHRMHPSPGRWRRMGIAAACLAALASISMARAGFGSGQAASSRYFEVALLLLPVMVLGGHAALGRRGRRWFLALLFAVCAFGFSQRWSERPYRNHEELLASGVVCLQQNMKLGRALNCGTLYPGPLDGYVERAKLLNLSFYRGSLSGLP